MVLSEPPAPARRMRVKRTLLYWAPYIVMTGVFLFWRLVIYEFPSYQPIYKTQADVSPAAMLWQLAQTVVEDAVEPGLAPGCNRRLKPLASL